MIRSPSEMISPADLPFENLLVHPTFGCESFSCEVTFMRWLLFEAISLTNKSHKLANKDQQTGDSGVAKYIAEAREDMLWASLVKQNSVAQEIPHYQDQPHIGEMSNIEEITVGEFRVYPKYSLIRCISHQVFFDFEINSYDRKRIHLW